jgi:hypothetical protein
VRTKIVGMIGDLASRVVTPPPTTGGGYKLKWPPFLARYLLWTTTVVYIACDTRTTNSMTSLRSQTGELRVRSRDLTKSRNLSIIHYIVQYLHFIHQLFECGMDSFDALSKLFFFP